MRKVEILNRRTDFVPRYLRVQELELRYEMVAGELSAPVKREVGTGGDAVGVLVYDSSQGCFVLVRQLRAALLRHDEPWLLEIVAGMIDEGETPEEAGRREVEEEIGYRLDSLTPLGSLYASPGVIAEKVWLFFAEVDGSRRVNEGGGTDPDEYVEIVNLPIGEAYDALADGELRDAKTQIALLRHRLLGESASHD